MNNHNSYPITHTSQLRQAFLDYFAQKGHPIIPSSPLVPIGDDTLLFTNSGMVQFKDVFCGIEKVDYTRAVSAQKCIRAGGKHNDLDNVGYTARHHTFFEMLGNFSFGDYFKEEAIEFAWGFLTEVLQLKAEQLWISVYKDDDEAHDIWVQKIGIDPKRISRCGEEDNFWQMGDTGPCGPCSEIFFDHGESVQGGPPGSPEQDGDRYIEIWNLVFTQFDRQKDGTLVKLNKPSVDTGMGLERMAAVLQGVHNNFDTDSFKPIIDEVVAHTQASPTHPSVRVLADHIRPCAFLLAEGVDPSNEGRGYVLRRIIRRAIRHAHHLGHTQALFYKLVKPLVVSMGKAYPELKRQQSHIEQWLKKEDEQFCQTLDLGMKLLKTEVEKTLQAKKTVLSASVCFTLYDRHGFPLDLTQDVVRESGLSVDEAGFDQLMAAQKQRSKKASHFVQQSQAFDLDHIEPTLFMGYDTLKSDAEVTGIFLANERASELNGSDDATVVLNQTPFYAEAGGQVADKGYLIGNGAKGEQVLFEVLGVQKQGGVFLHFGRLKQGTLKVGALVSAEVENELRAQIAKHHSATHLLHAALHQVLGEHAEQRGSLVNNEKLRFDFLHSKALSSDEIEQIEGIVNQQIMANHPVLAEVMSQEKALKQGAKALFGEKYGSEVRVLKMGRLGGANLPNTLPFSVEFCGGTHTSRTGDIGVFRIVSESAISSGVRRIEAVCGLSALQLWQQQTHQTQRVSQLLQVPTHQIFQGVEKLKSQLLELKQENKKLKQNPQALHNSSALAIQTHQVGKHSIGYGLVEVEAATFLNVLDSLKNKHSVVFLIRQAGKDKFAFALAFSPELKKQSHHHARDFLNELIKPLLLKGGGRQDLAQAGGECSLKGVKGVLKNAPGVIERQLDLPQSP